MDGRVFYKSSNKSTKHFSQWDIDDAGATDFSATADDSMQRSIDLNEQLIRNKPATFVMRIDGDAMIDAGIAKGDIVIVDRSVKATNGKVVIALLNGEMLIRRLEKSFNKIRLIPECKNLSPIDVDISGADFSVWRVVTYCIHAC